MSKTERSLFAFLTRKPANVSPNNTTNNTTNRLINNHSSKTNQSGSNKKLKFNKKQTKSNAFNQNIIIIMLKIRKMTIIQLNLILKNYLQCFNL